MNNKILESLDKLPKNVYKKIIVKCFDDHEKNQEILMESNILNEDEFSKLTRKNMLKYILSHNQDTLLFNKYFYEPLEKGRNFGKRKL